MTIEELAMQIAKEWQMSFDGVELGFALEVARRSIANEREACALLCESLPRTDSYVRGCKSGYDHAGRSIRARSNASHERLACGEGTK